MSAQTSLNSLSSPKMGVFVVVMLAHIGLIVGLTMMTVTQVPSISDIDPMDVVIVNLLPQEPVEAELVTRPQPVPMMPTASPVKAKSVSTSTPRKMPDAKIMSASRTAQASGSSHSSQSTALTPTAITSAEPSGASSDTGTTKSSPAPLASTAKSSDAGTAFTPPRYGVAYLNNPAPKYPAIAKRQGQQGRVLMRVLVTAEGAAKDVQLLSGSGFETLDDAALKAVRRWRFVPAKQGDTAVSAWVQVPIEFKLN